MEAGRSFTARRSAASNLPPFQLPPPDHLSQMHKYPAYATSSADQRIPKVASSVLTPPASVPNDGLSPLSSSVNSRSSSSSVSGVPPYQPVGYWPTPQKSYTFSSAPPMPASYTQQQQSYMGRPLYSPSMSFKNRDAELIGWRKVLPPLPYDINLSSFPTGMPSGMPRTSKRMSDFDLRRQSQNYNSVSPQDTREGLFTKTTKEPYNNLDNPHQVASKSKAKPSSQHPQDSGVNQSFKAEAQPCDGAYVGYNVLAESNPMVPWTRSSSAQSPPSSEECQMHYSRPSVSSNDLPAMASLIPSIDRSQGNQMALVGGMCTSTQYPPQPTHRYHPGEQQVNNDRPFKCDQCSQSFNRNHDLKRHKRVHLAVKPFPCGHCEKSFSRKEGLKRHILVRGCGKDPANGLAREDFEPPSGIGLLAGRQSSSKSPETKNQHPKELHVYQGDSSSNMHQSKKELQGKCDQLQVSSDKERVTTVLYDPGNPKIAESQSQNSGVPSSPKAHDKCTINLSPSPQGESSSRNNTLSSLADDDTDWGEDELTGNIQDLHFPGFSAIARDGLLSQDQMEESLTRPIFSPMKQELIDRIMKEFWDIFNQETEATQNRSPIPVQEVATKNIVDTAGGHKIKPSRIGCINCKIRRVKCDETRPQCIKCVRFGRKCDGYPAYKRTVEVAIPIARRPGSSTTSVSAASPSSKVVEEAVILDPLIKLSQSQNDNTRRTCDGGGDSSGTAGSVSLTGITNTRQESTQSGLRRRRREDEDNDEQSGGDERNPKRPRTLLSPPVSQDDSSKFACPYRKRDPRKYCVQHWRPCALTPLESVARVKGHLYRHHSIFPCLRCKVLFKDQDAVNRHVIQPKSCEVRDIEHADGVTMEIVAKLRSKKRTQQGHTEADRWKHIYRLLFPNEMIPSPYFEAIQEDLALSPDSRELADYEEYCRRELPRDFRAALEEIVHNESQPIEESIRNQLMNIIRDCQDRVFSRYRSSAPIPAAGTPSRNPENSHSMTSSSRGSQYTSSDILMNTNSTPGPSSERMAPPFFQPPSPQTHLRSRLEVSDLQTNASKASEGSDPSDSGYSSNSSAQHSGPSTSFHHSSDTGSFPSSLTPAEVEPAPDSLDHIENIPAIENGTVQNQTGDVSPSTHEIMTSTFDNSWLNYDPDLPDGTDWNEYMSME